MRRTILLIVAVLALAVTTLPAAASRDAAAGWHVVDVGTRITAADRAHLDAAGAESVAFRGGHAYRAWLDTEAARAVESRGYVVAPLAAMDKVDHRLDGASGRTRLDVVVRDLAAGEHAARLGRSGRMLDRYRTGAGLEVLIADVDASLIGDLASDPAVLHVAAGSTGLEAEGEADGQVLARNTNDSVSAITGPGYRDFLAEVGVDGSGVTVSIVDDGVDDNHPDLAGRMVGRVSYGATPDSTVDRLSGGHGTHVAGIAVGGGVELPLYGTATDDDGLAYGLGIAPGAQYVDQDVIVLTRDSFPPDGGFAGVTAAALERGAAIWNASWTDGGGAAAGYVQNAAVFDALTRDANPDVEGDQPFTFVFSAGNSGQDGLTSPKEAKNIISVAASNSHYAGPTNRSPAFSSRGPTRDGRVAPTVTAPGAVVSSTRSLPIGAFCNVADSNLTRPVPVDGLTLYTFCSGTSMAAPQVTGAVALLTERWRQDADADPSPAMARALLVNTASPLRSPIPNPTDGWGLVNLRALLGDWDQRLHLDQEIVLTDTDEAFTTTATHDGQGPLRVTVAWTDAPGDPGADPEAPALVNDLDLVVTAPDGTTFLGNVLDGSLSVPGGEADRLNNVESVFLDAAEAGEWTIEVRAHHLPGAGVPRAGSTTQDFALVIDGTGP